MARRSWWNNFYSHLEASLPVSISSRDALSSYITRIVIFRISLSLSRKITRRRKSIFCLTKDPLTGLKVNRFFTITKKKLPKKNNLIWFHKQLGYEGLKQKGIIDKFSPSGRTGSPKGSDWKSEAYGLMRRAIYKSWSIRTKGYWIIR